MQDTLKIFDENETAQYDTNQQKRNLSDTNESLVLPIPFCAEIAGRD
jgi:hypothetical protein